MGTSQVHRECAQLTHPSGHRWAPAPLAIMAGSLCGAVPRDGTETLCKAWEGAAKPGLPPECISSKKCLCSARKHRSPHRHSSSSPRATDLAPGEPVPLELLLVCLQPAHCPVLTPCNTAPLQPSPLSFLCCFPSNQGPERDIDNSVMLFSFCSWLHDLNRAESATGTMRENSFIKRSGSIRSVRQKTSPGSGLLMGGDRWHYTLPNTSCLQ